MKPSLVELIFKMDLGKMELDKHQLMEGCLVEQMDQNQNLSLVEAGTASSSSRTEEETTHHPEVILVDVEVAVDHLEMEVEDQDHGVDLEAKDLEEGRLRPC